MFPTHSVVTLATISAPWRPKRGPGRVPQMPPEPESVAPGGSDDVIEGQRIVKRQKHRQYNGGRIRKTPEGTWAADIHGPSGRLRRRFKTLRAAQNWVDVTQIRLDNETRILSGLEYQDAVRALSMLPEGTTFTELARYWLRAHGTTQTSQTTLQEAIDRFLADKRAAGLRPRSMVNLEQKLGALAADHGAGPVAAVEGDTLLDWLNAHGYQATTRDNYRRVFRNFFGWCVRAPVRRAHRPSPAAATRVQWVALAAQVTLKATASKTIMTGKEPAVIPRRSHIVHLADR